MDAKGILKGKEVGLQRRLFRQLLKKLPVPLVHSLQRLIQRKDLARLCCRDAELILRRFIRFNLSLCHALL